MNLPNPPAEQLDRFATLNQIALEEMGVAVAKCGAGVVVVWLALFAAANGKTGRVTCSLGWLVEKTGMDRKTVRRARDHLVKAGMVDVIRAGTRGRPSVYNVRHLTKDKGA